MDRPENDKHRDRVIEVCREGKMFLPLEDGFFRFFPDVSSGAFSAFDLRIIADELDRLNEPVQKDIDDYFSR